MTPIQEMIREQKISIPSASGNIVIVEKLIHALKSIRPDFLLADVVQNGFGLFRIVPEIGLLGNQLFVFYLSDLTIVVKDTSLRRSYEPSSLSTDLLSLLLLNCKGKYNRF